ncbi:AGE family epimerase/isomerase [Streptomyces sp. NPDC054765]
MTAAPDPAPVLPLGHPPRWLTQEAARLLSFAPHPLHPQGGFAWLNDDGSPRLDAPVHTWITCRMIHVFALGQILGQPGAEQTVQHGVHALSTRLQDADYGGWYAAVTDSGPTTSDKSAYDHAFVVLAASSATLIGTPTAADLLQQALETWTAHWWDDETGLVVNQRDRTWRRLDPYRGATANMHAVEALLAAADVTGENVWRDRALRITEQIVHGFARENDWLLPEHFSSRWKPEWEYHQQHPHDVFRPYGVTIGLLFEWARMCLHLHTALGERSPGWLLEDAIALFDTAVRHGWNADGRSGFVYTVDWTARPVVNTRLHWVVAEAIAAASLLHRVTADAVYDSWYRLWWQHADQLFLDRQHGSWRHELTQDGTPASTVWSGKPDLYHALQATLLPQVQPAPSLATALQASPLAGILRPAPGRH